MHRPEVERFVLGHAAQEVVLRMRCCEDGAHAFLGGEQRPDFLPVEFVSRTAHLLAGFVDEYAELVDAEIFYQSVHGV